MKKLVTKTILLNFYLYYPNFDWLLIKLDSKKMILSNNFIKNTLWVVAFQKIRFIKYSINKNLRTIIDFWKLLIFSKKDLFIFIRSKWIIWQDLNIKSKYLSSRYH